MSELFEPRREKTVFVFAYAKSRFSHDAAQFLKGKALNIDEEPRLSLPAQETSSAPI